MTDQSFGPEMGATMTEEQILAPALIAQIESIVDATEEWSNSFPEHAMGRGLVNAELVRIKGVRLALTADASEAFEATSDNPLAREALVTKWIEPEAAAEVGEIAQVAESLLEDLKERYPKKARIEIDNEDRSYYEDLEKETDKAWAEADSQTIFDVQSAAQQTLPLKKRVLVWGGIGDEGVVDNYREVLALGLEAKTGINISKCYLTPEQMLRMWDEVRDETAAEVISRKISEIDWDPETAMRIGLATTMLATSLVTTSPLPKVSADSTPHSAHTTEIVGGTPTHSSGQTTSPTEEGTTGQQTTSGLGATSPTGSVNQKPISTFLPSTILNPASPSTSVKAGGSAPEATTTTEPAPTTTTTQPPAPAPRVVAVGPPPEVPGLSASTRVQPTNPPVAPTSDSTEVAQGYVIPGENTPKGFDNWDISSNVLGHSGFTAAEYDQMVAGTGLAGVGAAIYQAEKETNINGLFMLSHMAVESNWGRSNFAKTRDNYWGLGAYTDNPDHAFYFQSVDACLKYYTDLLIGSYLAPQDEYYGGGTTVHNIFVHYSTSDSSANELANQAEDETITGIINNFLAKAQAAELQPTELAPPPATATAQPPAPAPATITTITSDPSKHSNKPEHQASHDHPNK